MGIAKLLFFNSTDMEKQTLHRRITPSQDQQSEQQERWNDLAEYLVSDLDIGLVVALELGFRGLISLEPRSAQLMEKSLILI